jgi:hypothetical protein
MMCQRVLVLQDANGSDSASEATAAAQQLGAMLQGRSAPERKSNTKAALSLVAAAFTAASKQADVDSSSLAAVAWQALPLKQADVVEEMQLALAALAEVVAMA